MIETTLKSLVGLADGLRYLIASLLVSSFALIGLLAANAYGEEADTPQKSAISAIQAADAAGADTKALVDRFNRALGQASSPTASSCFYPQECTGSGPEGFQSIAYDANTLRDQAITNSYIHLAASQAIAIIAAFLVALAALLLHHYRDSIQMKKYLQMVLPKRAAK